MTAHSLLTGVRALGAVEASSAWAVTTHVTQTLRTAEPTRRTQQRTSPDTVASRWTGSDPCPGPVCAPRRDLARQGLGGGPCPSRTVHRVLWMAAGTRQHGRACGARGTVESRAATTKSIAPRRGGSRGGAVCARGAQRRQPFATVRSSGTHDLGPALRWLSDQWGREVSR